MPDMTGRPGCRTMEMFGGSTASYLARTPRIPLFMLIFIGQETKNVFRLPGAGGEHFHCTVDPSPGHIRILPKTTDNRPKFDFGGTWSGVSRARRKGTVAG